jgi:hypothetical protein
VTAESAARREREAEALRENLKRRKSQAAARRSADGVEGKDESE